MSIPQLKHLPAALIIALGLLLLADPAYAFRCGSKVVNIGDSAYQVRKRCGEPDDIMRRFVTVYRKINAAEEVAVDVEVEEWIYDRGRNRLVTILRFADGVLIEEWTDGYGS